MNNPAFSLTSKTAVITGGASGIGLAIARRFAVHGAAVEIFDFQTQALDAALHELRNVVTKRMARFVTSATRLRLMTPSHAFSGVTNAFTSW